MPAPAAPAPDLIGRNFTATEANTSPRKHSSSKTGAPTTAHSAKTTRTQVPTSALLIASPAAESKGPVKCSVRVAARPPSSQVGSRSLRARAERQESVFKAA